VVRCNKKLPQLLTNS